MARVGQGPSSCLARGPSNHVAWGMWRGAWGMCMRILRCARPLRYDLSLGGEAVPLQWINEVDASVPPPIVFVRRCIDVDRRPDWLNKPCKACSLTQTAQHSTAATDRCSHAGFPGKPDGHNAECNWRCHVQAACDALCQQRNLQRGAAHRLQVFRHELKGWCLRTLTFIKEGSFVMEYVAERVSRSRYLDAPRAAPATPLTPAAPAA